MNEFVSRGVNYFFHDVICQYWPWASRQNFPSPAGALEIVPCLPAMHAKAHSWHCSVCGHCFCVGVFNCLRYILGFMGRALAG